MKQTWQQKSQQKIIPPNDVEKKVDEIRQEKKTIATLNGSFDLMHAGHLEIIYQASLQADILFVALNSDCSIKVYKNTSRPLIPLSYRLLMMAALEFVDYVTWFDEMDPRNILQKIKPNIHVNGSEYKKDCIEQEIVEKNGGKLVFVERIDSLSTTKIIEKVKKCV